MMSLTGSNYNGSSALQTSTENQQILPLPPSNWTIKLSYYKFSFMNDDACTVKINDGDPLYLRARQGFNSDARDAAIWSFVVIEPDITFNWIGAF